MLISAVTSINYSLGFQRQRITLAPYGRAARMGVTASVSPEWRIGIIFFHKLAKQTAQRVSPPVVWIRYTIAEPIRVNEKSLMTSPQNALPPIIPLLVLLTVHAIGCGRSETSVPTTPPTASATISGESPVEIDLRDATITAQQIEQIVASDSLRRLRLGGSDIDDVAIAKIATLPQLELLDLVNCQSLTPAALVSIGQIKSLRNLRLSGQCVTDQSIQNLTNLKQMAAILLQQTAVTDSGISVLSQLPQLKDINLFGTSITDGSLATFKQHPKLEKLGLRGTAITGQDASPLAELATVKELDLSETAFASTGMPSVAAMPQLTKLNLWLTKVDDAGVESLLGNTRLTSLNLDNVASITDASIDTIATLTSLQYLHIGGTAATAGGIERLAPLTKLEILIATRLGLTADDATMIRKTLSSLQRLDVD